MNPELNTAIIRSWGPCESPSVWKDPTDYGVPEDWEGTLLEVLESNRVTPADKIWVAVHVLPLFCVADFAAWCAHQARAAAAKSAARWRVAEAAAKSAEVGATAARVMAARVVAEAGAAAARDSARAAEDYKKERQAQIEWLRRACLKE